MKLRPPQRALGARIKLGVASAVMGSQALDMMQVMLYRPEFFGRPMGVYHDLVLRSPSGWTVGERELLAAKVSQANQCAFCSAAHRAIAGRAIGHDVVHAVLDESDSSRVSAAVRAALAFVEKLTISPEEVGPQDIADLRSAGISDDDAETIIHIAGIFNIVNRVADSLGFDTPSAMALRRMSLVLLKAGYNL